MLKTKETISKFITKECSQFLTNREEVQNYTNQLYARYNLPYIVSVDLLTLKTSIIDVSDNVIFYIIDVIKKDAVKTFFTEKEIKKFSSSKYVVKKLSFPLRFDVVKINDLQYNGVIYSKQLIALRDGQYINYNENTQRPVKHKNFNGVEYYVQDINRRSVNQISELMKKGEYISDQITLNLPEEAEWYYDEEAKQLVVKKTDSFDITDGNHRYIAMSNLYNIDPNFDYPMELRITCFNEDKTNQFMYQVDQRNKLNRVDLALKNQNNPSNQVLLMLNDTRELKGLLSRDGRKIDPGAFSILLSLLYFNKYKKVYTRSDMVTVKKELQTKLASVIDDDPDLFDKKWNNVFLLCVLFICSKCDDDIYNKAINLQNKIIKEKKINLFEKRDFVRADILRLEKIYNV